MDPQPLEFPASISLARPDDLPGSPAEKAAALARIQSARITTGFVMHDSGDPRYRAFAEANVHAPRVWPTFVALVRALLPPKAAAVVGADDVEPHLCHYTDRDTLLAALEEFGSGLAADCFVEFGAMWQTEEATEEVFVRSPKYFQVWTSQPDVLRATLTALDVPEVPRLEFIDEYPRTTTVTEHPGIGDFVALVGRVVARCADLPRV